MVAGAAAHSQRAYSKAAERVGRCFGGGLDSPRTLQVPQTSRLILRCKLIRVVSQCKKPCASTRTKRSARTTKAIDTRTTITWTISAKIRERRVAPIVQ